MNNEAAALRLKAEACQRLADLAAPDPTRMTFWLTRADQWNELATKADKKARKIGPRRNGQSADIRNSPGQGAARLGDAGDE